MIDVHSEQAVLGSVLLDRDVMHVVAPILKPEHFHDGRNSSIWLAMQKLYSTTPPTPCDTQTVAAKLNSLQRLDSIGGMTYLWELSERVPTPYHAEYYARNVVNAATVRRLSQSALQISRSCESGVEDVDNLLDFAQALVMNADARTPDRGVTSLSAALMSAQPYLQAVMEGRQEPGIKSGHVDYDRLTGGMHRSDLIVSAARPGMGKTSLMLCRALYQAGLGKKIGIFSLEMAERQLIVRAISVLSGVNSHAWRGGFEFAAADLDAAMVAMAQLHDLPIVIDDTSGLTISSVRSRANRMAAEHGLDVLYVDYLQLISDPAYKGNRVQEVGSVARGLKSIARELDITVVALAQLSRENEKRASKVPTLADLRDSGEIEQEADLVEFIYRDEVYNPNTETPGVADIIIDKNRHGPTGSAALYFDARTTKFMNLEKLVWRD